MSDVSREGERATLTKCGLVPELRLDRRDSPSQRQRGGAGTSDQRIEEREREKGTKRAGGGSEFPSVAGGKVREREGGHGPTAAAEEGGPVACCGGREALLHCNKSGGHVTRGSAESERGIDREVLNDLHLRQNKGSDCKKRSEA